MSGTNKKSIAPESLFGGIASLFGGIGTLVVMIQTATDDGFEEKSPEETAGKTESSTGLSTTRSERRSSGDPVYRDRSPQDLSRQRRGKSSRAWSTSNEMTTRAFFSLAAGRRASASNAAEPTAAAAAGAGCSPRFPVPSFVAAGRRASAPTATTASLAAGAGFSKSFDDSRYWDYAFRFTHRQDIGNQCRECKRPFLALNKEIAVRRGGRIELRYHKECFSMVADPRSQPASTANVGKFVESLKGTEAPEELYQKMRTRGHW